MWFDGAVLTGAALSAVCVGVCVGACVCACCVDFFSAADFLSLAALEVCFSVLLSAGFDSCFRSASFFAIIYQLE